SLVRWREDTDNLLRDRDVLLRRNVDLAGDGEQAADVDFGCRRWLRQRPDRRHSIWERKPGKLSPEPERCGIPASPTSRLPELPRWQSPTPEDRHCRYLLKQKSSNDEQ